MAIPSIIHSVPVAISCLRFTAFCTALFVLSCLQTTVRAQTLADRITDDFEQPSLNLRLWNPLQIRPGRYRIDRTFTRTGHGALSISVSTPDLDCDGTCQRNEIRIANHLRLRFGQGAWYGFSFQVRGNIAPDTLSRWVIGQWKEETDGSPFLAQRYSGRVFHITAQNNDCRVLVARSGSTAQAFLKTLNARDYGAFSFVTNVRDYACDPGIEVEYGDDPILPDPYGAWVDMVYFVQGGRNGTGVIEVWANGRFVARLKGSIGNDAVFGPSQYFKIGMYRDPMPGDATLYFDNFRRGATRAAVDPSKGAME